MSKLNLEINDDWYKGMKVREQKDGTADSEREVTAAQCVTVDARRWTLAWKDKSEETCI